ncbi:MAG: hypothetical protein V2A71_09960, partial [Candidatus Eisenbacteria bacterium]
MSLVVDFPDVRNEVNRNVVQARFSRELDRYVREMSYGRVSLKFDFTDRWHTMPPPGVSSWTRMRLGWIDRSKIRVVEPGERAEIVLGALEEGSSETAVIKISLSGNSYYLVENRQPIG